MIGLLANQFASEVAETIREFGNTIRLPNGQESKAIFDPRETEALKFVPASLVDAGGKLIVVSFLPDDGLKSGDKILDRHGVTWSLIAPARVEATDITIQNAWVCRSGVR
ncbi:MAG: hypothetical protein SFU56_09205 [Capsulimonadales bacterium]|nr:hypothetical protein [Capsulimonadales bacterium]